MASMANELVEVQSKAEGFVGSYYEAKVVKYIDQEYKYLVEYTTLYKEEDGQEPLTEIVDGSEIRPVPPPIKVSKFKELDMVDAYHNDGWWVGIITGDDGDCYYYVYFPEYAVELKYHFSNIRLHQKFRDGRWFSSLSPRKHAH